MWVWHDLVLIYSWFSSDLNLIDTDPGLDPISSWFRPGRSKTDLKRAFLPRPKIVAQSKGPLLLFICIYTYNFIIGGWSKGPPTKNAELNIYFSAIYRIIIIFFFNQEYVDTWQIVLRINLNLKSR